MSQKARILSHLKKGGRVTPLEAVKWFGCLRLAARIADLRDDGHKIITTIITVGAGKKVAQYHLEKLAISRKA